MAQPNTKPNMCLCLCCCCLLRHAVACFLTIHTVHILRKQLRQLLSVQAAAVTAAATAARHCFPTRTSTASARVVRSAKPLTR